MNEGIILDFIKKGEPETVEFKSAFDQAMIETLKGHLAALKSEGCVERIGSDRKSYWKVK